MSSSPIDNRKVFEDGGEPRPFFITNKKALYPADYVTEEEAICLEETRLHDQTVTVTLEDDTSREASIETSGPKPGGKVFFDGTGEKNSALDWVCLTFADSTIKAITAGGETLYERSSDPPLEATVLELRMTTVAYHDPGGAPSGLKKDLKGQLHDSLGEDGAFADENGPSALARAELVEGPSSKVLHEARTVSVDRARQVWREVGRDAQVEEPSAQPTGEKDGAEETKTSAFYEFAVGVHQGDAKVWDVTEIESTSWADAEAKLKKRLAEHGDTVAFIKRYAKLDRERAQPED